MPAGRPVRIPSLLRVALFVTLPCAGFVAAWWLRREPLAPAPAHPEPAPARVAERHALAPQPVHAAPAPATRAAPVAGDEWVELNNEATTDLTAGELVAAVQKFERCLAAEPASPVFAGNLAEALVRLAQLEHERGQIQGAVEHLARAIEVGSAREDIDVLRRILERWRRELEIEADDWTEDSQRFELTYDTHRDDILHHSHEVLEHLEESYDELVRWFGSDPLASAPPIRVVLYDPAEFDRLTGLGDWAAGLFDGVVRVSVRDLTEGDAWRAVLVHELVHAFVHALRGAEVPGWLNEGLAQWLEGRGGDVARLRERLKGSEPFPLARLAGSLATWDDRTAIARAYAQSLVFVAYLHETYGDDALRRMLDGGPEHLSIPEAFERWTSVSLEVAFQDWCESLER